MYSKGPAVLSFVEKLSFVERLSSFGGYFVNSV